MGELYALNIQSDDARLAAAVRWLSRGAAAAGLRTAGEGYPVRLRLEGNGADEQDFFQLELAPDGAVITGNRERAVIYGADELLARIAPLSFFEGVARRDGSPTPPAWAETVRARARFADRSAWVPKGYGVEWLEALVHNRFNHIGISDVHAVLDGDAEVRGILAAADEYDLDVTVGGHIVSKLVDVEALLRESPECCALIDGERTAAGHLCYSNPKARSLLAAKILECARRFNEISGRIRRFTVWSEDSAVTCRCDACRAAQFNEYFVEAVREGARRVADEGLDIRVEFLIYNALLGRSREGAFGTLEPPPRLGPEADCLVAYWGRDYSAPLARSSNDFDRKGRELFERAAELCREAGCAVRLYEYYIDHWQLGDLFPFLGPVIFEDMAYYHERGARGFLFDTAGCPTRMSEYPIKRLKLLNLAFAGRAMWDDAPDYDAFMDQYCASMFGPKANEGRLILTALFEALAPLSWLNLRHPVPGLVGGNLWFLDMPHETFVFDPDDENQSRVARRQLELYRAAIEGLRETATAAFKGSPDGEPYEMLGWYVHYVLARLNALVLQLESQQELRRRAPGWRQAAEQGLSRDDELGWPNREYFDQWLQSDSARSCLSGL